MYAARPHPPLRSVLWYLTGLTLVCGLLAAAWGVAAALDSTCGTCSDPPPLLQRVEEAGEALFGLKLALLSIVVAMMLGAVGSLRRPFRRLPTRFASGFAEPEER